VRPAISSWEELGGYLREVRKRQARSQDSVSGRASAAGLSIRRERISEIENARRDRPSELELRAIMMGLRLPEDEMAWLRDARTSLVDEVRPVRRRPPRRWRRIAVLAAVAIVAMAVGVAGTLLVVARAGTPGPAAPPPVNPEVVDPAIPNRFVEIVSAHSGKCLDKSGDDNRDGARVILWQCWRGDNQQWNLARNGIPNLQHDVGRWLALTVPDADQNAETPVRVWSYADGRRGQRWQVSLTGAVVRGWRYLTIRNADTGKCLAVHDSSMEDGVPAVQMPCDRGQAQLWRIRA
jgi:transcriptional regulator with XRE-family HTH domain